MVKYKKIVGFPRYLIGNDGSVLSTKFRGSNKTKHLKLSKTRKGYLCCLLYIGDGVRGRKSKLVHRLVAEAFLHPDNSRTLVNHKDLNKQNNNASNLEWVTNDENMFHARANGANSGPSPESSRTCVLSWDIVNKIRDEYDGSRKHREIAEIYGVSRSNISNILRGTTWIQK